MKKILVTGGDGRFAEILKKTKKVDFVYIPLFKDIYKSKQKSKFILKFTSLKCMQFSFKDQE